MVSIRRTCKRHAAGWSDSDILDAVNHGARMVAGDIVINGFKVERDF